MARIHVVGAGPAGSIAAISAARCGHDVIVSEEHPVSGTPENCSGLFSRDGLESLLPFLDYRKHAEWPIYGADISLAGAVLSVRRDTPVGFVCDRAGMDMALSSLAGGEGAILRYGERITGSFRSEHVIGADGPFSFVARHFSFPKIRRFASTLQAEVRYKSEDPSVVEVFLSNTMFPGFFAWIIPHDEYTAEFGVGVEASASSRKAWESLLKLKGVANAPKPRGAAIPLSTRPVSAKKFGGRSVLLAGDAAGQVKSTTGGGVIFGGNCAALAGRHATDPAGYERSWRSRFGPDLFIHSLVHRHLASRTDRQLSELGRRLKKLNIDGYLSSHGHMDRPTRMMGPALVSHMIRSVIAEGF
ncbi:MAG: FAD-binding protein [Candidatus Micrarchaeota archaeon]